MKKYLRRNGMSISKTKVSEPIAKQISFEIKKMRVSLTDGREIIVPLEWFPSLKNASKEQLNNWRFIGKGLGIHWEDLDEDISIKSLLV
jgi:hypothetical protein